MSESDKGISAHHTPRFGNRRLQRRRTNRSRQTVKRKLPKKRPRRSGVTPADPNLCPPNGSADELPRHDGYSSEASKDDLRGQLHPFGRTPVVTHCIY